MADALWLARAGDLPALQAELLRQVARFDSACLPGSAMDEHEKLTAEAYHYAKRGDLDEATHRLRLRDEPKIIGRHKYHQAMAETRRAREAADEVHR